MLLVPLLCEGAPLSASAVAAAFCAADSAVLLSYDAPLVAICDTVLLPQKPILTVLVACSAVAVAVLTRIIDFISWKKKLGGA